MSAKEKIEKEILESKDDSNIKMIGNYLLGLLESGGNDASDMIMTETKSIKGSLEVLKKKARAIAVGGCAMMTDEEGFKVIREYFGINEKRSMTADVDEFFMD